MKKQRFLLLLLAVMLPVTAWSQGLDISSLESQISYGIFENPLDAAFNVWDAGPQPNFSTLERNYLFAGLTNFNTNFTTTASGAISTMLGYYSAEKPWSAYTDLWFDATTSTRRDGTTNTTAIKQVLVVGPPPTTTDHTYDTQTVKNAYDFLEAKEIDVTGQFLMGNLGPLNAGLYLSFYHLKNAGVMAINPWADLNRTRTETNYYDTAGAGVAPVTATDYTYTSEASFPDPLTTITVGAPLYLPIGGRGLAAVFEVGLSTRDASDSATESYTAPQDAGAGAFPGVLEDDSIEDKTGSISPDILVKLALPPLMGNHPDNMFEVGAEFDGTINTAETYVDTLITQTYTYAGGGADLVPEARSEIVTTIDRKGTLQWDADLFAQHYFYFDLAEWANFGIGPKAMVGAGYSPPASNYNTEEELVEKFDVNADGDFTDALDTIVTTTTTYKNNDDGGNFDIRIDFTLPSALKVRLERWPFGMTFGNELKAGLIMTQVKDMSDTESVEMVTTDGTGTTTNTVVTTEAESYETESFTTAWVFEADYKFGLNFYLPGDATLDVLLNWSNLFEFDSLIVQAIIPLP